MFRVGIQHDDLTEVSVKVGQILLISAPHEQSVDRLP